jgi:hypothetical protein
MAKDKSTDPDTPDQGIDGSAALEKIYNRYNSKLEYKSGNSKTDPSDNFSKNYFLDFYHVASKNSVQFMAYLTDYNENYDVNTDSVAVYGRADPIHTYQNTQRNISVTWVIPSRGESEAIENVNRLSTLIKFLYPAYKPIDHGTLDHDDNKSTPAIQQNYFSSATALSKPPLIRLKYANIISNNITSQTKHAKTSGLLGFITSLNHTYDMDSGGFTMEGAHDAPYLLPKTITVTITFKPIHEHPIGWASDDNKWIGTDIVKHKIYEKDQGPRDLEIMESELPTFPFGIGTKMLGIPAADIEATPAAAAASTDPAADGDATAAGAAEPTAANAGPVAIESN